MYSRIARRSHDEETPDMAGKANRRGFGYIRKLPSRRHQASYIGPDMARHAALKTFDTKGDAEAWLIAERTLIAADTWTPPKLRRELADAKRPATFSAYAAVWLKDRDLKPRTRWHYQALLDNQLKTWDPMPINDIRPEMVRDWHANLNKNHATTRAHAYGLLRTILATAVSDGLLPVNPCHIRGAGTAKRIHKTEPLSLPELEGLVAAMPAKYRPMTLLAAWCALRFGELVELRRKDIDLQDGVIRVRRGAVRADGQVIIGTPKSEAGIRDVAIPPHLIPMLRDHLSKNITGGKEGLLFPATHGGTLAPSTLYKSFYPARDKAGRPDLRWHDLRHTGAVLAAQTGATLAELMGRLGHSTPSAALRYQHAAEGRDAEIAQRLSALATGETK
ncbi:MAG: tyrosine-type recombinase/integrase [Actinomycetota bacterium]